MKTPITRREVLQRLAILGGSMPLMQALSVLGLSQQATPALAKLADEIEINPNLGAGKKVAIIGAGLSGLTAAYELSRRGFECHIFEADKRAKGRAFTVRPDGSNDSWYQEVGRKPEICTFDEIDGAGSLYFEAGAGRIPSHHRTTLNYCKKFQVELQTYIFASRANLVRSDDFNQGKPVQMRRFKHNLRGYLAEMLRTADSARLDTQMSAEEQEQLLDKFSQAFGKLNAKFVYQAEKRAGYQANTIGAGNQAGEPWQPFAFADLLRAEKIWRKQVFNDMSYYWQPTLLQPVAGIDKIATAFMRQPARAGMRIGNLISLQRQVVEIKLQPNTVHILHQQTDSSGNKLPQTQENFVADFCIATITPSLLHKIENNFTNDFQKALLYGVTNVPAGKVAWQADRFWEADKYQIYGGISWTSDDINQIWYPSTGFHNQRGILIGAYYRGFPESTLGFGNLERATRIKHALSEGIKLHPELDPSYKYNDLSKAMTIAWQDLPFQDNGWVKYTAEQRQTGYQIMLAGQQNKFFMAGDAMSYMPGWIEGAISAGLLATENILQQLTQTSS